jgi:hypothetical protein
VVLNEFECLQAAGTPLGDRVNDIDFFKIPLASAADFLSLFQT